MTSGRAMGTAPMTSANTFSKAWEKGTPPEYQSTAVSELQKKGSQRKHRVENSMSQDPSVFDAKEGDFGRCSPKKDETHSENGATPWCIGDRL